MEFSCYLVFIIIPVSTALMLFLTALTKKPPLSEAENCKGVLITIFNKVKPFCFITEPPKTTRKLKQGK